MKDSVNLDRRGVLGTVGGLAAAGSGLAFFAGSAAATVKTGFTAHDAGVVTTADGSVQKVLVETDGTYSWKGLDSPVKMATVTLEAKKKGSHVNNYAPLTSKSYSCNGLSGKEDFELDTVDLTDHFGDEHFESNSDGKRTNTKIDLRISVTITSADGSTNGADAADSMSVGAKNEAADANIDGESHASASSYDQKFASSNGDLSIEVSDDEPTFHVVAPDAFPKPAGYDRTHVELFFDAPNPDGNWDIQIRRHSESGSTADGQTDQHGFAYQTNGGSWKTDFGNLPLSVAATDHGFTVTYTGNDDLSGEDYGVGAHQTTVDENAQTEVVSLTKSGSGRPWHADNLVEDQM